MNRLLGPSISITINLARRHTLRIFRPVISFLNLAVPPACASGLSRSLQTSENLSPINFFLNSRTVVSTSGNSGIDLIEWTHIEAVGYWDRAVGWRESAEEIASASMLFLFKFSVLALGIGGFLGNRRQDGPVIQRVLMYSLRFQQILFLE